MKLDRFLYQKMVDSPDSQSSSMSGSKKSTGKLASGTEFCTTTNISSSNCSVSKTSVVCKYDESVEVKEEIIEDQSNSLSDSKKSTGKLAGGTKFCTTTNISSSNCSASKTSIVCKYDESVEVKEEIIEDQSNSLSDSKKSTGKLAGGTEFCTTTNISSSNCSVSKTSVVHEYDDSVEVKEEIIEEIHQGAEHNLLFEKSQLDEKSNYSGNKTAVKTEIVYKYDETLEIKEEVIQDPGAVTGQKLNKKYESTWNTVDTIEASSLAAKKLRTRKKKKIKDSKPKPEKKFKCQKCARSYKAKCSLYAHRKFECGITPQFICEFCNKRFKRKGNMDRHVWQIHQKANSNQNKEESQESKQTIKLRTHKEKKMHESKPEPLNKYNCLKCGRSYRQKRSLGTHLTFECGVPPQFICEFCCKCFKRNSHMQTHVGMVHLKTSQASYKCDKCFLRYSSLSALRHHDRLKHAADKPEFTCDDCGYKASKKSTLSKHISSLHLKITKLSQARHNCDKCSQSYSSWSGLYYHNLAIHAAVKRKFICDVCGYKANRKYHLSIHISSHQFITCSKQTKIYL